MELAKTLAIELQRMPTWAKNVLIVSGASIVLGLFAHVSFPLPFSPVPVVTQSGVVLFFALLLGSKRAAASVLAFLGQAAVGLPVLAGGHAGLAAFSGPSGGYLFGYLAAAYLTGRIAERFSYRKLPAAVLSLTVGTAVILTCGALWLSTFLGWKQALLLGVAPFVIGDALKIVGAVKLLQWMGWMKSA
jgi:biotin transport system substrate-specific component